MTDRDPKQPRGRAYWVPQLANPDAPTAAELASGIPIGEVVCDGLQFVHRDRHSEQARHIDERVREAFGMPPVGEELSAHELPPGAHQIIPGEVIG